MLLIHTDLKKRKRNFQISENLQNQSNQCPISFALILRLIGPFFGAAWSIIGRTAGPIVERFEHLIAFD